MERRCCLEAVVETETQHAARYRGAEPYRHRRVISDHTEFVLDTLGYVKPVKLSMHQLPQTTIELPCTTDYTSCRVQHSLQLVVDDLWSPSEDNVTVVDAERHKGMHERRGRLRSQ